MKLVKDASLVLAKKKKPNKWSSSSSSSCWFNWGLMSLWDKNFSMDLDSRSETSKQTHAWFSFFFFYLPCLSETTSWSLLSSTSWLLPFSGHALLLGESQVVDDMVTSASMVKARFLLTQPCLIIRLMSENSCRQTDRQTQFKTCPLTFCFKTRKPALTLDGLLLIL